MWKTLVGHPNGSHTSRWNIHWVSLVSVWKDGKGNPPKLQTTTKRWESNQMCSIGITKRFPTELGWSTFPNDSPKGGEFWSSSLIWSDLLICESQWVGPACTTQIYLTPCSPGLTTRQREKAQLWLVTDKSGHRAYPSCPVQLKPGSLAWFSAWCWWRNSVLWR